MTRNEHRDHHGARELEPFFLGSQPMQILYAQWVDRVKLGLAITAAQRDRLDRLLAGGALLGVAPGRQAGSAPTGRSFLDSWERGCPAIRGTAANVGPAFRYGAPARSSGSTRPWLPLDATGDWQTGQVAPSVLGPDSDEVTIEPASGTCQSGLALAGSESRLVTRCDLLQLDLGTAGA